jgi:hypothetical protein
MHFMGFGKSAEANEFQSVTQWADTESRSWPLRAQDVAALSCQYSCVCVGLWGWEGRYSGNHIGGASHRYSASWQPDLRVFVTMQIPVPCPRCGCRALEFAKCGWLWVNGTHGDSDNQRGAKLAPVRPAQWLLRVMPSACWRGPSAPPLKGGGCFGPLLLLGRYGWRCKDWGLVGRPWSPGVGGANLEHSPHSPSWLPGSGPPLQEQYLMSAWTWLKPRHSETLEPFWGLERPQHFHEWEVWVDGGHGRWCRKRKLRAMPRLCIVSHVYSHPFCVPWGWVWPYEPVLANEI